MSAADELRAIYAEVPKIDCRGDCHPACGPIAMQPLELQRMRRLRPIPAPRGVDCPLLTASGRCSAYRARPLICRLWGVVESMPCTYGCIPERVLTDAEAHDLMERVEQVSPGEPVWLANPGAIRRYLDETEGGTL